ncbi:MAG: hypothetical protein R3F36_09755 [Candidatus Competibacteraceae bacterium]
MITSCCGSLFSAAGQGVAAELASLPARPALVLFLCDGVGYCWSWGWRFGAGPGWDYYLPLPICWFTVAIAGIVAFLSLYV